MPTTLVRLATASDLPRIPEIELSAAQLFTASDLPPRLANEPTPPGVLRRAMSHRRLWVAELDEGAVGFVLCSYKDTLPYVRELDVLPDFGRRGIGTQLMHSAIEWAQRRRAEALLLTTFRHLPFNAPFYQKLGFEEVPLSEQGEELRRQLLQEARRGLDPKQRVAMRLRLHYHPMT